jgi:hypothetical protein
MAAESDFRELAKIMQNFFDAVNSRTDVRVEEAVVQLDAFHGETAAMEAMARACEATREGEEEESRFWMAVFHQLTSPVAGAAPRITVH